TTARAYREALSLEQATGELVEQAGKQFDPQVANCLIELLGNGTLSLSEEHRVVTSYTITPVNGDFASEDYQRIRRALFPAVDRASAARKVGSIGLWYWVWTLLTACPWPWSIRNSSPGSRSNPWSRTTTVLSRTCASAPPAGRP